MVSALGHATHGTTGGIINNSYNWFVEQPLVSVAVITNVLEPTVVGVPVMAADVSVRLVRIKPSGNEEPSATVNL